MWSTFDVWSAEPGNAVLLGHVDGSDYIDALQKAEESYGTDIEVYPQPRGVARLLRMHWDGTATNGASNPMTH